MKWLKKRRFDLTWRLRVGTVRLLILNEAPNVMRLPALLRKQCRLITLVLRLWTRRRRTKA